MNWHEDLPNTKILNYSCFSAWKLFIKWSKTNRHCLLLTNLCFLLCTSIFKPVLIFSRFQELRAAWELHSSELFILPQLIEIDPLLLHALWLCFFLLTQIFQSRLFNNTPIALRVQPIAPLFPSEWGSLSPGSVETSDLPEKKNLIYLQTHEHCLVTILHRVKLLGIILTEENNVLWQSVLVCFHDWQIVLHRSSLILTLPVVWLYLIGIVICLWKVLFDYFYIKAVQKYLLIQSIKIWAKKLADKLSE